MEPGSSHEAALRSALAAACCGGLPGISVAIALPDGDVWTGADGWANALLREEMTPEHRFCIGSITKPVVAAVILQLADEGKVSMRVGCVYTSTRQFA